MWISSLVQFSFVHRSVAMTMKCGQLLLKFVTPFSPVLDVLFSCLVVGPLAVIFWMSTWRFYDTYLTPNDSKASAAISLLIGAGGQFLLSYYQGTIEKCLKFKKHSWININCIMSKVFILVLAQTNISLWRGVWNLVDIYSPVDTFAAVLNVLQYSFILMVTKAFCNSISSPFIVETDEVEGCYRIPTYFKRVVN